jgi:hypothetical protein
MAVVLVLATPAAPGVLAIPTFVVNSTLDQPDDLTHDWDLSRGSEHPHLARCGHAGQWIAARSLTRMDGVQNTSLRH